MKALAYLGFVVLGVLALRGMRWAYITFIVLGLLYFPVSAGFHLNPQPCELAPSLALALFSFQNYAHIVLFVLFFFMTSAQFRMDRWAAFGWAGLAAITMGALVEIAQGVSGKGHCRVRDLIPDAAGILIGAGVVLLWRQSRKRSQTS